MVIIMAIIAFIMCIIIIIYAIKTKGEIENGGEGSPLWNVILIIGSILLFAFFLIACIFVYMYGPF